MNLFNIKLRKFITAHDFKDACEKKLTAAEWDGGATGKPWPSVCVFGLQVA